MRAHLAGLKDAAGDPVFAVTARDRAPLGNPAPVLVLGNLGTSDYEALPSGHAIADTPAAQDSIRAYARNVALWLVGRPVT